MGSRYMELPYYYYKQIFKYLYAFADVFSQIQIARYNTNGEISHYEKVPILFPGQDKIYQFETQRIIGSNQSTNENVKIEIAKTLPIFTIKDISFTTDEERKRNKYDAICESVHHSFIPVPYSIQLNLKLNFEKIDECFQVIEQIFPLFNPHIAINVNPINDDFGTNLSIPIYLLSNSNIFPSDITEEQERTHQFTLTMKMDVWIFGKVNSNSDIESNISFTKTI